MHRPEDMLVTLKNLIKLVYDNKTPITVKDDLLSELSFSNKININGTVCDTFTKSERNLLSSTYKNLVNTDHIIFTNIDRYEYFCKKVYPLRSAWRNLHSNLEKQKTYLLYRLIVRLKYLP